MVNKPSLLACLPDFPFPARKNGVAIRYAPILTYLSRFYDIHLICITGGVPAEAERQQAEGIFNTIDIYTRKKSIIQLSTKLVRWASTFNFTSTKTPFSYLCYDDADIELFIHQKTHGKVYDVALCVLADYASIIKKIVHAKKYALDFIDSPFATAKRTTKKNPLALWDLNNIRMWEHRLIQQYDSVAYISPLDKKIGAGKLAGLSKISLIPNGLYLEDVTSEKITFTNKTIGYLGNMSYLPNIKAAKRLHKIFFEHLEKFSNAKLVIIGRDPSPEIQSLAQDELVIVTGNVDNIWPYINGVDIFVFPMEIGSGQQNKILETMGAGKIVITTELGNSGIGATHRRNAFIENTDSGIASTIQEVLTKPEQFLQIKENAKSFVSEKYCWENIFTNYHEEFLTTRLN